MAPSAPPALSDVTNGPPPSLIPAIPVTTTPRKTSLASAQPSLTPPDTPVTPPSPPYVTATSTPSSAGAPNKGLAAMASEQQHAVRNVFQDMTDNDTQKAIHLQPQQIVRADPPTSHLVSPDEPHLDESAHTQPAEHELEPSPVADAPPNVEGTNPKLQAATERLIELHPSSHDLNPENLIFEQPDAPEDAPEPPQIDAFTVESATAPTVTETSEASPTVIDAHPSATECHQDMSETYSNHDESPRHEHASPHPLTDTYPSPPLSEAASYNSPPLTPPPATVPADVWTGATCARSPKLRLAAAAAVRASMAPATSTSSPNKLANRPGPFRATRPVSPRFQLAAAAASRAASAPREEPTPKVSKTQPAWGVKPTVPKSPKLRSVGKALSAEAAARKAKLLAEQECHEAEIRRRVERLRASRASWANTRTTPKSPAVLRHRSTHVVATTQKKRFTPTPLPDFGHAPPVKQTRASIARLQRNGSGLQQKMLARPPKHRQPAAKPLGRTVPHPFPLQGVNKHEEVMESLQRRQQLDEAEARRSRMFEPVPLREEILEGPTFIPSRSDPNLLTDPVCLLPDAEQRSMRTLAYLAAQRERMEELEMRKMQAAREREDRELEDAERVWQQRRFKPRPIPKSHYKPDIPLVGSIDDSGETERDLFTPGSQSTEEEQVTPPQDNSESVPRRPSLFEGLRKSLSPLLGAPDAEKVQANGDAQQ